MDRPLGRAVGNALEVEEALATLAGEGPADLVAVTLALGTEMLLLGGAAATTDEARRRLTEALDSGRALEKFGQVIEAQGGNSAVIEDPGILPQAEAVEIYAAPAAGVVARVDPRPIGEAVVAMGGGRRRLEDEVDPTVGFVITVKPGDRVTIRQPIASVFARDAAGIALGMEALGRAVVIGDGPGEAAAAAD